MNVYRADKHRLLKTDRDGVGTTLAFCSNSTIAQALALALNVMAAKGKDPTEEPATEPKAPQR